MLALSFGIVVATASALWWGYGLWQREFPEVSRLKGDYPSVVYRGRKLPHAIRWSNGRPAAWVGLGQISRAAVAAVVVSEDSAFYQHPGYDAAQIKEALEESLEEGRLKRGASTITQQVTRNVFLSQERSLWRKFKELILAIQLEEAVGKRRILETYFNIAEWGEGVYGIGPAARHYFGKSPAELTPREGAFLAMLLPSPKRYSQSFRAGALTPYARRTVRNILNKMVVGGRITPEERDLALASRMGFERRAETGPEAPEGADEQADPEEGSGDAADSEGNRVPVQESGGPGLTSHPAVPQTEE